MISLFLKILNIWYYIWFSLDVGTTLLVSIEMLVASQTLFSKLKTVQILIALLELIAILISILKLISILIEILEINTNMY